VTTGDFVTCGGQSGIADHVHLGSNTTFAARSGVHKDMAAGGTYVGAPAMDVAEAFKVVMSLPKVPDLRKQVRRMEDEIAELKRLLMEKAA
jgi:UDP-3-O-[3-hydroxymyristoyl] glucosamine N-acyltransferase